MRWIGVLVAAVLLVSVVALAVPMGKPGPATTVPGAQVGKATEVNTDYVAQKRARIMGTVMGAGPRMGVYGYERARNMFANMYSVMKKTAEMAQYKYKEWYRYRAMYMSGEINEEVYLEKTKEFITSVITATVERLNVLVEGNVADENLQYLIERLKELNAVVSEINDLNELRALYTEEIKPLLQEARTYFKEVYAGTSVAVLEGVVHSIDVWAQRVLVWAEKVGIDANELQPYLDELASLKEEIASIKEQYLNGQISAEELLERIREIRARIVEVYRNIMALVR